ncbi:MAG: hypothetical protein ACE5E5_07605 [Phycisphaerae bacterium]
MNGKTFGMVLFFGGFLAGSLVSVRRADSAGLAWATVEWGWFAASMAVGLVGVVMMRLAANAAETASGKVAGDLAAIGQSLSALQSKIGAICAGRPTTGVYEVHGLIDDQLAEELGVFVDARETVAREYGLPAYAELMNHFALAERNINRAWSASADGYEDEVWLCMQRAETLITKAKSAFDALDQDRSTGASVAPA